MKKITLLATIFFSIITSNAQVVSTFAGSGINGNTNGIGTAAQFSGPNGVCTDTSGNVFIAEYWNNCIRKITSNGVTTTYAGIPPYFGYADGFANQALFNSPSGVCTDSSGNLYVADTGNNLIRKITPNGIVSTLAGSTDGYADGTGTSAKFSYPNSICIDASGNLYVTDANNNRIRKISPIGVVTTLAGTGLSGFADGTSNVSQFNSPSGICMDFFGNIYVADSGNNKIRKITSNNDVTTLAGSTQGFANGPGISAQFDDPEGISSDGYGNIYVADFNNNKIRRITPNGIVTTFVGTTQGFADGSGSTSQFYHPIGVCFDTSGIIYVADFNNNRIRKITFCNTSNTPNIIVSSSTNSAVCQGQSITLSATGGAIYSWSNGQNTGIIAVSPIQTTTYTVTATNTNGCSSTASKTVNINPIPTVIITGSNLICNGQNVTLTASGGNSYLWSNGSVASSITLSPSQTTTYTVTGTNLFGCTSTSTKIITVNPTPIVSITGVNSICNGLNATLTVSGGSTYLWSNGNTTSSITVNPTITTTYSVDVINSYGCTASSIKTITVNPLPTISFTGQNSICYGQNTTLTASGGSSYLWSNGNTSSSITVNPSTTTTYSVTATNIYGCTSSTSKTITVNSLPIISITPANPINLNSINIISHKFA